MTRRLLQFFVATSVLLLIAAAVWFFALYSKQGSLSFGCGMLATSKDQFLDGSGRIVHQCSWHFGNGLRTWGETYGLKFGRCYLTVYVTHIDSRWTKTEAAEE
jgi:hypothetical protein